MFVYAYLSIYTYSIPFFMVGQNIFILLLSKPHSLLPFIVFYVIPKFNLNALTCTIS